LDGGFETRKCSYLDEKFNEDKWRNGKPSSYGIKTLQMEGSMRKTGKEANLY
jgi:hypothetical protein